MIIWKEKAVDTFHFVRSPPLTRKESGMEIEMRESAVETNHQRQKVGARMIQRGNAPY